MILFQVPGFAELMVYMYPYKSALDLRKCGFEMTILNVSSPVSTSFQSVCIRAVISFSSEASGTSVGRALHGCKMCLDGSIVPQVELGLATRELDHRSATGSMTSDAEGLVLENPGLLFTRLPKPDRTIVCAMILSEPSNPLCIACNPGYLPHIADTGFRRGA